MKSINNKLKYYDLYMFHSLENIQNYSLPEGYSFVFFKDGDEIEWVKIEMSAGEVLTIEEGLKAFNKSFGAHYDLLKERCLFIVNEHGEKVATSTAYFLNDEVGKVHWVAIKKEEQGNKLSKPLITETLKLLKKFYKNTILHTQTHTWLAVKIYLSLGFVPYEKEKRIEGWNIIYKILNNDMNDIYDEVFVSIDNFIQNKYGDVEYKIYDKFNQFKVKTNTIHTYSYEYNHELIVKKI